jgi:DNA adenine methylase
MIGPLAYIGGKRRIASQIVALLPRHTTYVEPFAGGAQVFFPNPKAAWKS